MTALTDRDGIPVKVDQGETMILEATFYDPLTGGAFNKSAVTLLQATLLDKSDNSVINTRENQNVLDVNGGVLATSGLFQLTLGPDDNVLNDETNASEIHLLILKWQWFDEAGATQTGIQKWDITVVNTESADEDVVASTVAGLDLTGIKRVKTKHIEVETHDPRHVQTARDKEYADHPTFCSLSFCKGTPK